MQCDDDHDRGNREIVMEIYWMYKLQYSNQIGPESPVAMFDYGVETKLVRQDLPHQLQVVFRMCCP